MQANKDYYLNSFVKEKPVFVNPFYEHLNGKEAQAFHQTLHDYKPEPLYGLQQLAEELGLKKVWLKDETKRLGVNTFKALGASFAVHKLKTKDLPETMVLCTATDGNHGKSLAWAARVNGFKAHIFVPKHTVQARIDAIKQYGAEVTVVDGDYDKTVKIAEKTAKTNGWTQVQDTAWQEYQQIPAWIMQGYMTHFIELENLLHLPKKPRVDAVFLQAGVGTWAAAGALYYIERYQENRPKIVIVEPSEASCLLESASSQMITQTQGKQETLMAGLNCGTPSLHAWEILKDSADVFMRIPDQYAIEAVKYLNTARGEQPKMQIGESGAAGLAALFALSQHEAYKEVKEYLDLGKDSVVLLFATEGVTDPELNKKIIEGTI